MVASGGDRGKLGVGRLILSKTDVFLYIDKVLLIYYCECGCFPREVIHVRDLRCE